MDMYSLSLLLLIIFSLFRSEELEEVETKFITFKDKIPVFVEIAKDVSSYFTIEIYLDIAV